ncbi:MAG: hypothetical protein VX293_08495 [Candidatus Latescibacterota bacterium]|nr:hypothetical protein [Candidatus Latescibacterota bacterium]
MSAKKKRRAHQRALASSNKGDWYAHIQSLGLSSPEEYQAWCHQHGLRFHRKKAWRQEREEHRSAERGDETVRKDLETLGLESVEVYQGWCRQRGLSPSLDKGPETLKNEVALATLAAAKRQMGSARALIKQIHAEQ